MTSPVETVALLLLVASVVALVARRLGIPYTVALVLAGVALAASPLVLDVTLTRELIYVVFLPPLVFEAALSIEWDELRRELPVVLCLATLGVVVAAAVVAGGMHALVGWAWPSAALFSVLIAATDPVSVIATFRDVGVQGRLRLLVESESLLNDVTAAIGFGLLVTAASGSPSGPLDWAASLVTMVILGVASGLAMAGLALALAGRTGDHLVQITLTTVAAYGSFLLAERLHASGVLAAMTAGLVTGHVGRAAFQSDRANASVEDFWAYLAFAINSIVFILIGLRQGRMDVGSLAVPIALAIGLVLLARALSIYGCSALFARSRLRVPLSHQHVLVWGGLRGALALALALGLPVDTPRREEIVTVVFGVVVFSVLVQGVTLTPLLRRLGQLPGRDPPAAARP